VSLPPFPLDYRAFGVLLHVTSLPSPYGIGDVGATAVDWIDRLHEAGQSWWQALPVGPIGYGDSPYQPLSSFAWNGLLASPDWLIEDRLLRVSDCEGQSFSSDAVDYDAVFLFKRRLLDTASTNFNAGARPDLQPAFAQFCPDDQRQHFWSYLKRSGGDSSQAAPTLMSLAWSSIAALAIAPLRMYSTWGRRPG
jgi:4-alpha-glucanotransferase